MRIPALGLAFLWAGAALAEPVPPRLVLASSRSVSATAAGDDLSARRSIRGVTVEGRESPELRAMREFEEDRFGPLRLRDLAGEPAPSEAGAFAGLRRPDIPVRFEPRVQRYLELYKNERRGRSIMTAWLKRQGRYRELIESALDRHHLPRALLYIAMIESGYDPRDRSSAGAAGVWQFMPEGGRIYGLRIDYWLDERNDPEKSTEAVMRYFSDLHARFGSWHLALAAFNAGYGAVMNSVAKYNTNDYWELCRQENGLPWETVNYVPKFLATATVGANREAFGYGEVTADPAIVFDRVPVPPSTTLANVARAAGVTLEQVAQLNPELRRDRTPPEEWQVLRTIRLEALRSEPQAFSSTYAETLLRPDVYWRDRLASDRSVTLIARSDQRPIGLVGGYFGSDEGDESVAVVVSMYVNQAYRGRGIGRWLLRSLIGRLAADRRIATIRLWVRPDQQPARRLYESLGFRVAGQSVDPDGVELIMELDVHRGMDGR